MDFCLLLVSPSRSAFNLDSIPTRKDLCIGRASSLVSATVTLHSVSDQQPQSLVSKLLLASACQHACLLKAGLEQLETFEASLSIDNMLLMTKHRHLQSRSSSGSV